MTVTFTIHSDGGARGNPGPAGIGIVIEKEGESEGAREKIAAISEYIGETTNNQAEYRAVIRALETVKEILERDIKISGYQNIEIECFLDSELIVEQLKGNYRVKNAELKPLHFRVGELVRALGGRVTFRAVPRHQNREADQLVNQAIDQSLSTAH